MDDSGFSLNLLSKCKFQPLKYYTNQHTCFVENTELGFHRLHMLGQIHFCTLTELNELQCEEGPKSKISSTPPTAQTAGGWEYIRGIELASPERFLNFHLEPPKIAPPRIRGPHPHRALGGLFLGVPDGNSKIAQVTPVLCL